MTLRQEEINKLEEKIQTGKDLKVFLKEQTQTQEMKALNEWLNQEIRMLELSIMMVKERLGWK